MNLARCDSFRSYFAGLAAVGLLMSQGAARASVQTVPTSLNPGDQYRLVFVTARGGGPTSSDINTYNAFVSTQANAVPALAALGIDWKVIGSTAAVSARVNTGTDPTPAGPTGVPIFLLNDTLFATDYDDLWDGHPTGQDLNITEQGNELWARVWTGDVENGLGQSQVLGGSSPLFGNSMPSLGTAIPSIPGRNGWMFDWTQDTFHPASFYAMSGILTVPGDPNVAPEPATVLVWGGLAVAALAGSASRRRHCE